MFTYLLKTTCLPNGKVYWGTHSSMDLLFDLPYNQSIAWPQNREITKDYKTYGNQAFIHQVIQAFPAADTLTIEKQLQIAINNTPPHLRYNLIPASTPGREKTPEELAHIREWTYITNGKETRKVKKSESVPKGWIIGNGNLMSGKERAELRVKLREKKKESVITIENPTLANTANNATSHVSMASEM